MLKVCGGLLCLVSILGCDSKVTLSGNVSYDGNPIPQGRIRLTPAEGNPVGVAIEGGQYQFPEDTELSAGDYQVWITATRKTGRTYISPDPPQVDGEYSQTAKRERIEEYEQYLPQKYNRASDIKVTLNAGENQKDFTLEK